MATTNPTTNPTTRGLKKLGEGFFSICYEHPQNTKKVLIKTVDDAKECMSFGWFPSSRLFPRVKYVGDEGSYRLYEMKRYNKPRSLKNSLTEQHWGYYKQLRSFIDSIGWDMNTIKTDDLKDRLKSYKNMDKALKKPVFEALEALMNYGNDWRIELSPRNVAVSEHKELILLDIFFCGKKVSAIRWKNNCTTAHNLINKKGYYSV
jgi:hypothetical protein